MKQQIRPRLAPAQLWALLLAAWILGMTALVAPPAAHALPGQSQVRPTEVTVVDSADIISDEDAVKASIEKIEYPRALKIVVFTVDTGSMDDRALNDYVRDQALSDRPEWRSTINPDKFAEGLLILAVDPVARLNGAYTGEDLRFNDEQLNIVLEAAKPAFRGNRWGDGMIDSARAAADVYGDGVVGEGVVSADGVYTPREPTFMERNGGAVVGGGIVTLVAGGGTAAAIILTRRRTQEATRLLRESEATYADLSLRLGELDVNAATLPATSQVAVLVREDVRKFDAAYKQATQRVAELTTMRKNGKLPGRHLSEVRDLASITDAAAGLERRVDATNDILNQTANWQNSWFDQARELMESAEQVETLIAKSRSTANAPTAQSLRAAAMQLTQAVQTFPGQIEQGLLTPDAALLQLRDIAVAFDGAQNSHVAVMMESVARTEAARNRAQSAMTHRSQRTYGGGYFGGYNYGGGVMSSGINFTQTSALVTGYTVAASAARTSSSGGSSSGFSGGGSFSGSGGSSRF